METVRDSVVCDTCYEDFKVKLDWRGKIMVNQITRHLHINFTIKSPLKGITLHTVSTLST